MMARILICCILVAIAASAAPRDGQGSLMRRSAGKEMVEITANARAVLSPNGAEHSLAETGLGLGPQEAGGENDQELFSSTSSMELSEADRLWQQFRVLDGRFSKAAHMYMDMALSTAEERVQEDQGHVVEEQAASSSSSSVASVAGESATSENFDKVPYGFYLHVFFEASAVVNQLRDVRKYYPEAPVYIMSDGGANFSGICDQIKNCKFAWRAPAHDCWNPKPFLDRFREGAEWLQEKNAEWTIMLEPDVTLHRRATTFPKGADAGGLKDMWNPALPIQLRSKMEENGREFSGNQNFTLKWERFGFCGGSIVRTKAAVVSFRPDAIDWPEMEKLWGDSIYSSDVSMLIALGSHGYNYYPWEDVKQGNDEFQPNGTVAFEHHGSAQGKPMYGKSLKAEDRDLVGPPPQYMRALSLGQCQHCVWADEKDCWPKQAVNATNVIQCPSDQKLFRTKVWKKDAPNPSLFKV